MSKEGKQPILSSNFIQEIKEIIKEPMMLEFLGLKPQSSYYEKDLEISW